MEGLQCKVFWVSWREREGVLSIQKCIETHRPAQLCTHTHTCTQTHTHVVHTNKYSHHNVKVTPERVSIFAPLIHHISNPEESLPKSSLWIIEDDHAQLDSDYPPINMPHLSFFNIKRFLLIDSTNHRSPLLQLLFTFVYTDCGLHGMNMCVCSKTGYVAGWLRDVCMCVHTYVSVWMFCRNIRYVPCI